MNNNISNDNQSVEQTPYNNQNNSTPSPRKKTNGIVIFLAIIGAIVVCIIILCIIIFSLVSTKSNKLVCKSDEGNITIMYNDSKITGYMATGIGYDMDEQKEIANQIGIQSYISQFTTWFETNTTGTCSVKEK